MRSEASLPCTHIKHKTAGGKFVLFECRVGLAAEGISCWPLLGWLWRQARLRGCEMAKQRAGIFNTYCLVTRSPRHSITRVYSQNSIGNFHLSHFTGRLFYWPHMYCVCPSLQHPDKPRLAQAYLAHGMALSVSPSETA